MWLTTQVDRRIVLGSMVDLPTRKLDRTQAHCGFRIIFDNGIWSQYQRPPNAKPIRMTTPLALPAERQPIPTSCLLHPPITHTFCSSCLLYYTATSHPFGTASPLENRSMWNMRARPLCPPTIFMQQCFASFCGRWWVWSPWCVDDEIMRMDNLVPVDAVLARDDWRTWWNGPFCK